MIPALHENRFARDQRGQLFDLATGRDVPDRVQEETPADLPVGRLDALVRAVADVLDAGGPRVRVLALEALEADRPAGEHEDDYVAAEAGRRGFVPISLAGLRRLPAPGILARRSALVMARRPSTPGANALAEGSAVLLALSALRAKPMAVVATRAMAEEISSAAAASESDGARNVGGTLVSRTGPARVWQVAECSPVVSASAGATNRARSLRKMQALCGFHRRRGDWRAFLDASLWLSRLHLEREAPDDSGRVAHDARTWRAWWTDPSGVSIAAIARVLALLDVEACARLSSRDFDGSTSVEGVHAGAWVAEALGLRELKPRLSIHLAAIERRAGRLDAARRALGTPESTTPQTALGWSRESLWTALWCGNWPEAGRAAQELRELMTCAAASSVKGPAALELATFHLGIGDEGTARAVLAAHRDSLHALRGADRVRHALVRKALGLPAPVVAAGARAARRASGPGPWEALRRDYAALVRPRATARLANASGQGGAVTGTECVRRTNRTGECLMEDVLDLLRACHDAEDDQGGLGRMCLLVRERLGALAVGVWAAPHAEPLAGSGSGRHWPISLAERARTTGLPHGPETTGNAVEAAYPVTHAGAPIGALACRWLIDQPIDRARTEVMLSAAAAACVPLVRGTIDAKVQAGSASGQPTFGLVGDSEPMQELRGGIQRAALAPFHVLIEGESGSGKELVARAIHEASPRRHKRFCAVNCAALTDELLEAELFGHTRGAFTGALAERAGLFEAASGGTLFLDEVADLSPRGQAKVLRVLQDGEVRRVGENFSRRVDVRVVAATNKALRDEVGRGRFRAGSAVSARRAAADDSGAPRAAQRRGAARHALLAGRRCACGIPRRARWRGARGAFAVRLAGQRSGAPECDGDRGGARASARPCRACGPASRRGLARRGGAGGHVGGGQAAVRSAVRAKRARPGRWMPRPGRAIAGRDASGLCEAGRTPGSGSGGD